MQQTIDLLSIFTKQNFYIINIDNIINFKNVDLIDNFIYLNMVDDTLLITIKDNVTLKKPIYLVNNLELCNITANNKFSRLKIKTGENNNITLIDHKNNQNIFTELVCQKNSIIDYYLIQNKDHSKILIYQHYNSFLKIILLNRSINNNKLEIIINLIEQQANLELNVLQKYLQDFFGIINLNINHLATDCKSISYIRAIAFEQAKIEFNGKITIDQYATNTNADLQIKNLILSKQASIINSPDLIINNKNVICKHGSSTSSLDQSALFYMQTRGLNSHEATEMLLAAFTEHIFKKIKYKEITNYLLN